MRKIKPVDEMILTVDTANVSRHDDDDDDDTFWLWAIFVGVLSLFS